MSDRVDRQPPTHFIRQIIAEDLTTHKHQKIVTRFPPEPNGYLHIGHAKSICLNFGMAKENAPNGMCYLRYDDTNPSKESEEFAHAIALDVHWLGFDEQSHQTYASDYFQQLYLFAKELIEKNLAYVCSLSFEQIKEYRGTLTEPGKESPYRNRSIAENMDLFRRMKGGEFADGMHVLRAKIDMAAANLNMRDPIIYRIKHIAHHRTGQQWCIYPMYDFTHCLSDAIEHITHSLCTLEFEDHRPLYDWFVDHVSAPSKPRQIEFSRLSLEHTITSKRKLSRLVEDGLVSGWDDPRMPTLAGMRRRGYSPQAIREFCEKVGVTKSAGTVEMAYFEQCQRDYLETAAKRVMGVLEPLKIVIDNYPEDQIEQLTASYHTNDPEHGTRVLPFARELYIEREDFSENPPKKYKRLVLGGEVRLRHAYVIKCERMVKDEQGHIVQLHCTYDQDTLGKNPPDRKVKGVIHWVSSKHALEVEVRLYDRLFSVPNPAWQEKNGVDFTHFINQDSLKILQQCKVEPSLAHLPIDSPVQFERVGYFKKDAVFAQQDQVVFNRVVTLKDSWIKVQGKS